jgi:hypothetical protein
LSNDDNVKENFFFKKKKIKHMKHPTHNTLLSILIGAHDIHAVLQRMTAQHTALQRVEFLQNLLESIQYILESSMPLDSFDPRHAGRLMAVQEEIRRILQSPDLKIEALLEEIEKLDPEWEEKLSQEEHDILDAFSCPITREPFRDPVTLVQSGMNYQRRALQQHFKTGRTACPLTGTEIPSSTIQAIRSPNRHRTNILIRNETIRFLTRLQDQLRNQRRQRFQQLGATLQQLEELNDIPLEELREALIEFRRQKRALAAQRRRRQGQK